jgi:hypothetical protein
MTEKYNVHGIARDERGQKMPIDQKRAQKSQMEGPAAYAPHQDEPTIDGDEVTNRGTDADDGKGMPEENKPEQRPGPFAQDLSRDPPTKQQREKDYQNEKKETGSAMKRQPAPDLGG